MATIIFENSHYKALELRGPCLSVTNKRTGRESVLVGENAPIWIDNIKTAIDSKEASMLCRAIASERKGI